MQHARTKPWHSVLTCILEAVNPLTFCISEIQHLLRHQGQTGLPSLQIKSNSQGEFGYIPTDLKYFHLTHITELGTQRHYTTEVCSTKTPVVNEPSKTKSYIASTDGKVQRLLSSPLYLLDHQTEASLAFCGFMVCDRWGLVAKYL